MERGLVSKVQIWAKWSNYWNALENSLILYAECRFKITLVHNTKETHHQPEKLSVQVSSVEIEKTVQERREGVAWQIRASTSLGRFLASLRICFAFEINQLNLFRLTQQLRGTGSITWTKRQLQRTVSHSGDQSD